MEVAERKVPEMKGRDTNPGVVCQAGSLQQAAAVWSYPRPLEEACEICFIIVHPRNMLEEFSSSSSCSLGQGSPHGILSPFPVCACVKGGCPIRQQKQKDSGVEGKRDELPLRIHGCVQLVGWSAPVVMEDGDGAQEVSDLDFLTPNAVIIKSGGNAETGFASATAATAAKSL